MCKLRENTLRTVVLSLLFNSGAICEMIQFHNVVSSERLQCFHAPFSNTVCAHTHIVEGASLSVCPVFHSMKSGHLNSMNNCNRKPVPMLMYIAFVVEMGTPVKHIVCV